MRMGIEAIESQSKVAKVWTTGYYDTAHADKYQRRIPKCTAGESGGCKLLDVVCGVGRWTLDVDEVRSGGRPFGQDKGPTTKAGGVTPDRA